MKGVEVVILLVAFASISSAQFKSCGDIPSGVFTPNRANCDYFFLCVDGYLMQLKCDPYSIFDPIDQICTKNCNAPPVVTTTSTTTTEAPCITETASTTPSTPFPTAPVLTTTTTGGIPTAPTVGPPNTADPCYNLPTGTYVGIPGECTWYWYCRNGQGLMSQCPDGTCFNDVEKRCL